MKISEALSTIKTLQVFCNTFTKTSSTNLTIARNLVAKSINIRNGTNIIGKMSQYNQEYSVIGNTCTLFNTSIYNGPVIYGTSLESPHPTIYNFNSRLKQNPFDFDSMHEQLLGYSSYLRTLTNNSTKNFSSNIYTFTGNSNINIITLDSQDILNFQTCTNCVFNFPQGSLVILNFIGTDTIYFNNIYFTFLNNISEENIIINLENNNFNIVGTLDANILYTTTTISLNGATVNGSICANTITASGNCIINDSVIYDIDALPIKKLESPEISTNNYQNENFITITISNQNTLGIVMYSVNGGAYSEYISPFIISTIGHSTVMAYVIAPGFSDSEMSSETLLLTCKCENPTILFDDIQNTVTFTSSVSDAIIYFTLDDTSPTINSQFVYNGGSYKIPHDGLYVIKAVAKNRTCFESGMSHSTILVRYPVETLTINVLGTPNISGIYPDQGGNGVQIEIVKAVPSASNIYYTTDGSDPMTNGILYSGPFYTKSGRILAVVNDEYYGYSKIAEKDILIGGSFFMPVTNSKTNSQIRQDTLSNIPTYSMDIGWIGPTVIIDDTAIYQALINILSTPIGDIPFNLAFGVSIVRNLFEVFEDFNSNQIISQLKTEIEFNDPRILIDANNSYAYFIDETKQLVIDLAWINRYTNEMAHVKYGYNLDGIL